MTPVIQLLIPLFVCICWLCAGWGLARAFQPRRGRENEEIVRYIVRNGEQDGKPITREQLLEFVRRNTK